MMATFRVNQWGFPACEQFLLGVSMSSDQQDTLSQKAKRGGDVLSLDTVFTILSNQRRRTILSYLTMCTYPVPFAELVERVATQETDTDSVNPSTERYEEVAMNLYQTQLPKLADWGVIDYNQDVQLIRPPDTLRPFDEYLRLAEQHECARQSPERQHCD